VIIELGQSTSSEDRVPGLFATEPLIVFRALTDAEPIAAKAKKAIRA
jgi:hypothetical protein